MNICIFEGTICGGNSTPKYNPGDPNGKKSFMTLSVAVQSGRKDSSGQYETDFINCKAFGATADFINSHWKEKDHIGIMCSYTLEKYTNQQGVENSYPKFIVDKAYFVGAKQDSNTSQQQGVGATMPQIPAQYGQQPQYPQQQAQMPPMPQAPAQFGQQQQPAAFPQAPAQPQYPQQQAYQQPAQPSYPQNPQNYQQPAQQGYPQAPAQTSFNLPF